MKYSIPLAFFAVLSWACGPDKPETDPIVFEQQYITVASDLCPDDTSRCTVAKAEFPLVKSGPEVVQKRINEQINAAVSAQLDPIADEDRASRLTPEQAADAFIEAYNQFLLDQPDYGYPWAMDLKGEVLYQSDSLASIKLWSYSFSGGAHPNTFVTILNVNLRNGKMMDPIDWVADKQAFEEAVADAFRKARGLEPGADLQEEGFFWDGDFALPEQMGLTSEGFYFFYNSYEVAAYSLGPTEFVVPYEELRPALVDSMDNML